ncbi:MAG: DUF4097 domain-containing protein [Saccharofermentans sp.]|nr:DUF4097 domain-containing protein [Saccharofermentans sp.]
MENFSGDIKSVKLDLKACSVSFVAEEGSGLKSIEYTGAKELEPDAVFADGTLTVIQRPVSIFANGIMAVNKPRLTVTIGKDTILQFLDIYLKAGDVSVNGITADWFSEVINAGNVTISGCNFLKAEISTKAGNTYISNTNLNKTVINTNAGNVNLDAIEDLDRYDIECKVKTGDVKIADEHSSGKNISIVKGAKDSDYIRINVNVGSVSVN